MILGSSTFLGLAVSDRAISIAEVGGAGANLAIRKVMTFTLPAGVTLEQPAPAGEALKTFLHENGFAASRAVVGVPAKWLIARENDVPPAAPDQVRAMLSLAAERLSAAESSELVTDFAGRIDGRCRRHLNRPAQVLLVAMLRQRLEQLNQLAEAAGLSVAAVTSSALVLAEVARQAGQQPADLPLLLLGRQGAEMVFQHAGTPRMLRHVSVVAMNGHGVATGPLGAELRRAVALAPAANGTAKTGGGNGSTPTERELLLWDAVGLTDEQLDDLSQRMGVRVRHSQTLQSLGVDATPEGAQADAPPGQFAPAVSLALAGADRALLPIDFKRSRLAPRKQRKQMASLTSWAVILGAVIVIGVIALYLYVNKLESRLKVLDDQLATDKPKWDEAKADRERLDYGLGFFEKRSPMLEALREITLAFPQEEPIWVTNFTIREEKDQRKGKYVRRGMLIGKALSQKTASDVSDRLSQNPKFADVTRSFQDTGGRSREVTFTIAFTFTAPENRAVTLSKRERYIVILTVAVVGVLGLDQFFVSPLLARMKEVQTKIESSDRELTQQERDITNARRARRKWATASGGTVKRDAPEVESLINKTVRDWATETRMSFTGFRPFGTDKEKGFTRITYVVTGSGTMEQIGRFLHKIQTAKIPIRIIDLQLSPKTKEGVDELNLNLKVASIIETPDADKPKPTGQAGSREASISWN